MIVALLVQDDNGTMYVYRLEPTASIARTGNRGEMGEHEVEVTWPAGRDRSYRETEVGAAIADILGLDPAPGRFGEVGNLDQQLRQQRERQHGGGPVE